MTCALPANGTPTCTSATCGLQCNVGFADCDGMASNGCEAATQTDAANCGACGTVCPTGPHATATSCTAGRCGVTCAVGYADCDRHGSTGCEVDVLTSATNCGACGTTCPMTANGTPMCAAGTCGVQCNDGFGDCDGAAANGCEVNLITSTTNCGG